VEIDLNKAFAGIEICRVQRLATGEDVTDFKSSGEEESETVSCIDVAI